MIDLIYCFLPGIFILGIWTAYTDIRKGIIKNKAVVLGIAYALLVNVLLVVWGINISAGYIIQFAANALFAFAVGFFMWNAGMWTAGDGKLFSVFAMLVPLFVYNQQSYIAYFPSMNILINTVLPLFVFFFFNAMISSSWKQKKEKLKEALGIKKVLSLMLTLFVFICVIELIFGLLHIPRNMFLTIFVLFFALFLLEKFLSEKLLIVVLVVAAALRFIFDMDIYSVYFLKKFFLLIGLFVFLRFFVLDLGFIVFTTEKRIKDLKPGMVPAEVVYKDKEGYKKKKALYFSLLGYLKDNKSNVVDLKSEGITKKDIQKLKKLAKKHSNLRTFRVHQTLPFAPFLFLGVLLTIVASGNIVLFIINFL